MKYLVIALLMGAAVFYATMQTPVLEKDHFDVPKGFPTNLFGHARCKIIWEMEEGVSCTDLEQSVIENVEAFTPGPAEGKYEMIKYEQDSSDLKYVWSTRETPTKHYVDDVLMTFEETNGKCTVHGYSRSQSASMYDYSTNFCNLRNLFTGKYMELKGTPNYSDCKYHEGDHAVTCAKY